MAPRPSVTRGTSSDSSELSALSSDHGEVAGSTKKRARESTSDEKGKKKSKTNGKNTAQKKNQVNGAAEGASAENGEEKVKGAYCHNCRRACEGEYLRCTKLKTTGNSKTVRPCNLAFCDRDLLHRYNIKGDKVRSNASAEEGYKWECPCCKDVCWASLCRKKKGLEPLGDFLKAVKASSLEPMAETIMRSTKIITELAKSGISSEDFISHNESLIKAKEEEGSELSDIDGDVNGDGKTKGKRADTSIYTGFTPRKTPKKQMATPGKGTPSTKTSNTKATPTTKKAQSGTGSAAKKGNTKEAEKTKPKPKPKAKPKPKVPVRVVLPEPERPTFEKIDTRLGRDEAEQRIMASHKAALSFPERALPPVDDFDRPLTEANVRLFAGAMLDTIKEELEASGGDEELFGQMFNFREELRYYADIARFAAIYNILAEPLGLKLPSAIVDQRADSNNAALRAILDLDADQPAPAWATEYTAGPSRRTAASRIPPGSEVIRMLLGFAERTLSTPRIRADLDAPSGEFEMRKGLAADKKEELGLWVPKRRKLDQELVRCTTAAQTKQLKEEIKQEDREYAMRIALLEVNLRSQLGRRELRSGPLGVDLDGRVYYVLAHRPVEDDGRPPLGWASGLLVWGKGLPSGSGNDGEDASPSSVERWHHFGRSEQVGKLVKWVEWQFRQAIEDARANTATATISKTAKSPAKPKTPSKSTPSKGLNGSTKKTSKQKTLMEVVIPSSKRPSALSPEQRKVDDDDDSSTSSGLTPVPESRKEELLALLHETETYEPSMEKLEEREKALVKGLQLVLEWLEVLEWKGFGEV